MFRDVVDEINERLKVAKIPVRVRLNGNRLVLRATLPKKSGEGSGTKQYDLSLGVPANKDGFRRIEAEAQKLGSLIALDKFSWDLYLTSKADEPLVKTVAQLVEEFKVEYFRSHRIKEPTWKETWQRTFDRLPQDEPLQEASILAVVLTTENHTRNRELFCQRLQRLADFAGVKIDLKSHRGDYNAQSIEPRNIPNKDVIVEWRNKIPNPAWQWVYGIIATFGLRPHEAFLCEFLDSYSLQVLEGKTGSRITRAIYPEWVEQWQLQDVHLPNVTGRTHRDYGQRVSHQFSRYKMPFEPYDLRHAWAITASVLRRLPVSVAAAMMGHSVAVHTSTYHRWLSDAVNEKVYRELILSEGKEATQLTIT